MSGTHFSLKRRAPRLLCVAVLGLLFTTTHTVQAQHVNVIYSFQGGPADGAYPYAGLVLEKGKLYGTTEEGGTYSVGTAFKVTTSGTETVLHSFAGKLDGIWPDGALMRDQNDNLDFYGTTVYGGGGNYFGTVFEMTPTGTEIWVYGFQGGPSDGAYPFAGLANDGHGNLYGTTEEGGPNNLGTVFQITPTGLETWVYTFKGGPADGAAPAGGLLSLTPGNYMGTAYATLYGTTEGGGAYNYGTVFDVTPVFNQEQLLYSFKGGPTDGADPQAALVRDAHGNFYGTTTSGGAYGFGTVFAVTKRGNETWVYSFQGGTSDGAYPVASLAWAANGNLYGTTYSGGAYNLGTVFEITPAGSETCLYSFAGGLTGTVDGANPRAGLVRHANGKLYGTTEGGGAYDYGTVFEVIP